MHKNKTYIYPPTCEINEYIRLQKMAVEKAGEIVTASWKDFFSTKYYILNWFEQLGKKEVSEFLKKCFKIFLFILFRKKIFVVMHNKTVHTQFNGKKKQLSFILNNILFHISTKIIILCDESINVLSEQYKKKAYKYLNKVFKIPHPNYINAYKPAEATHTFSNEITFLFMGLVKKYKNIEILIDVINELSDKNIKLVIAGSCQNEKYKEELQKQIKNKNIICDFRYIPNDDINQFIENSDLVVLPYDISSSLNSGNIFLAFSNKRSVLCPLIGSLKEYQDKSFFYSYEYTSEDEHKQKLKEQILKIIEDVEKDPKILEKKGLEAFNQVSTNNSIDVVSKRFKELFDL